MIKTLSKHVHVREATAITDIEIMTTVVSDTMTFLVEFFQGVRSCHKTVTAALEELIHEETIMALVTEDLDYIDVLSSSHSVESIDDFAVSIVSIDHELVQFRVKGDVGIEFYWGGSGDDGLAGDESLPFTATMSSSIDDMESFQDVEVTVDASKLHAQFEPDIEC